VARRLNKDVSVIIPAAGSGKRLGARINKVWLPMAGEPMLFRTLRAFKGVPDVAEIVLAINPADARRVKRLGRELEKLGVTKVVLGGELRQDSVANALAAVSPECRIIAVHDAARPFVSRESILMAIAAARRFGAVVVAVPVRDTLKAADAAGRITRTLDREGVWHAQTPQVFRREIIVRAYERLRSVAAARPGRREPVTDDSMLIETLGLPVRVVEGSAVNFKVTTREDFKLAAVVAAVLDERKQTGRHKGNRNQQKIRHGLDM
jgi:2-C-methyl-D-erythritol 4-phosphate cytidylyltransferase